MGTQTLLNFEPSELSFRFELNKQLSSSIRLLNKTADHVAFKLLTTNPKCYGVRPRIGILLPGSTCEVTVTRRAVKEAPQSMRCKDKFMIQSAVASPGATTEDAQNMFNKNAGHAFQECKLRVIYSIPAESSFEASVTDPNSCVPEVSNPVEGLHDNVLQTSTRKLLDVEHPELQFPLSLNKELSCSLQLSNATENHVAFRVKTASTKFSVQPNVGIVLPQSRSNITVRSQGQIMVPSDLQSEDKFLIQSVVATTSATTSEDIILDMFDKATLPIEECELPVVYISKQENDSNRNRNRVAELILRGIITCLLGLVSFYLMKRTLSWIWSLAMVAIMLMLKMIKKLVSDSVEDWIVKTLLYIVMHFLFGRKDNIQLS